jgi:hypothetical protein
MVEILIQADDKDIVAREMKAAVREIFGIDPLTSTRGAGTQSGTRSLEAALLVLAIQPALASAHEVIKRLDIPEQWNRLIGKAEAARKDKGAREIVARSLDGYRRLGWAAPGLPGRGVASRPA